MVFHFAPLWQGDMHRETHIQVKRFLACNWENLHEKFILRAQVLMTNLNSIPFPQHDPPTHKCLFRNLVLGHAREYSWAICVLALFFLKPTSSNTTSIFIALHPKSNGYFPLFHKAQQHILGFTTSE